MEKGEPHPQVPERGGEEPSQDAYSSPSFILSSYEEEGEGLSWGHEEMIMEQFSSKREETDRVLVGSSPELL